MASDIKIKDPIIGRIMLLDYELMLEYVKEQVNQYDSENEEVELLISSLKDYQNDKITFNQLWEVFKKYGYKAEKPDTISNDVDYGEIATFDEINSITEDDIRPYKLGYKFNGRPAHPEYFNLEIKKGDKFKGTKDIIKGTTKINTPKIGGQKIKFIFNTDNRSEDGIDFWIELKGSQPFNDSFELRIIDSDGDKFSLMNYGILLENLIKLAREDNQYEMAIANGFIGIEGDFCEENQQILTNEEINIFKTYVRGFIEALEGSGQYENEFNRLYGKSETQPSNKKGCFGVILFPLITLLGLISWIIFS